MTTLTDFLLARITEDEAVARAAQHQDQPTWRADFHSRDAMGRKFSVLGSSGQFRSSDAVAHVVRFQPSRVIAECAARRRIVELHAEHESRVAAYRSPRWADDMNEDDRLNARKAEARCAATEVVVQALAQVYADHPDFDPSWAISE